MGVYLGVAHYSCFTLVNWYPLTSFYVNPPYVFLYQQILTMTNPSAGVSGDGGNGAGKRTPADNDSDVTSPGRGGVKKKDSNNVEKTWRLCFIRSSNAEQVHPSAKIHLQLIQAVQEQFAAENLKILTNGNFLMSKVDILKWSTDQHSKYFKIHPQNGHPNQDRQHSVSCPPPASLSTESVPVWPSKRLNPSQRFTIHSRTTSATSTSIDGQRTCGIQSSTASFKEPTLNSTAPIMPPR